MEATENAIAPQSTAAGSDGAPTANASEPSFSAPQSPVKPDPKVAGNHPVSVFYVDPVQYMANHVQYVRDPAGNPRLNTILLPPDLPPASGKVRFELRRLYRCRVVRRVSSRLLRRICKDNRIIITTTKADQQSIRGSFASGKNKLQTKSPNLRFEMELWMERRCSECIEFRSEEFGADFQFDLVTVRASWDRLTCTGKRTYLSVACFLT